MPNPGEKLLAAEMVGTLAISWVAVIWTNRGKVGTLDSAPKPQVFLPIIGAYSALALVAMFGPQAARLAGGIGGLVALVIVLKAAGALFTQQTTAAPAFTSAPNSQGAILA